MKTFQPRVLLVHTSTLSTFYLFGSYSKLLQQKNANNFVCETYDSCNMACICKSLYLKIQNIKFLFKVYQPKPNPLHGLAIY